MKANEEELLDFAISLGRRASELILAGSEARWRLVVEPDAKLSAVDVSVYESQLIAACDRDRCRCGAYDQELYRGKISRPRILWRRDLRRNEANDNREGLHVDC